MEKKYIKAVFEPFFADKKSYIFHICVSISLLIMGLLSIEVIRRLISSVETDQGFEVTMFYGFTVIFLAACLFGLQLFFSYLRPTDLGKIQRFLLEKYYHKFILLDNEKVNNYGTGKFMNIFGGIFVVAEVLYLILFELGISIIAYIFNIAMIGYINVYLVLPVVVITVLLLLSMNFTSRKTHLYRNERKRFWEAESRQKTKIFMEKFTILKSGEQQKEIDTILDINRKGENVGIKVTFFTTLLNEGSEMIINIGEVCLVLIIGYFIYTSSASFADMGALLFIMALVKKNINSLNQYYKYIINVSTDLTRLIDIFEEIPSIKNYHEGSIYKYSEGKFDIHNLQYCYPDGKQVFNKLNISIPGQKKIAFIGRSGSGKSTLVKLLLGFIECDSGKILLDDQILKDLSKKSYYKYIGYLSQEPNVFDGTIRENICYGMNIPPQGGGQLNESEAGGVSNIELKDVIKKSSCEFIYDFQNGLDTKVGEKGVKLSGGEKQRIAIARLFLQNPSIIILDEPTSALDSFSEESISKALEKLSEGKTMITIAHRLQTIKNSDIIFVFEGGKIIESGNHIDLQKRSQIYSDLIKLQGGTNSTK